MTNCGALASIDADREGLRDGMREVKVETFVAASSLQFDAIYERAISTLGTSFEVRYGITNTWLLEFGIYYKPTSRCCSRWPSSA